MLFKNILNTNINEQIFIWISRLLVAVILLPIHEFAHAYVADKLGDPTAKNQGRLTLNPLAHLEPLGTFLLVFAGFGWAKPVPVNSNNFKNEKRGMGLVSAAGPVSNILLALIFIIISKIFFKIPVGFIYVLGQIFYMMASSSVYLAIFNLLPIPPLDGSKILGMFLPDKVYYVYQSYGQQLSWLLTILILSGMFSRVIGFFASYVLQFLNLITMFLN